ncbi:MAG TPA: TadE family protein [Candidatus Limnocylindrales bacterium]|nr:TadE family protein [Candidatus Limnocylindrales bacterium]
MGTPDRRASERGQSIVEFALILPLLVFLMVAIVDLARIYTTMLSVESAAREAADYGTFGSQKWDAAVYNIPVTGTEDQMRLRACTAASDLTDYAGPDTACTNPTFSYLLSADKGATWHAWDASMDCANETRNPPCWVKVTLNYDFHLLVPLHIEAFGMHLGLPNSLTFSRTSVFPMTDLELP